jgi:hypothetical protein
MLLDIEIATFNVDRTMTVPYTSTSELQALIELISAKHTLFITGEDKNKIKKQMVAMVESVTVNDTNVKVIFSNKDLKVKGKTAKDVVKVFSPGTYKNTKVVWMVGHDMTSHIWSLSDSMTLTKSIKKNVAILKINLEQEWKRVLTYHSKTQKVGSMSQQNYLNYAESNLTTMPLTVYLTDFHARKYTLRGQGTKLNLDSNILKVEFTVNNSEWNKLPDQATIKTATITHQEEANEIETFNNYRINDLPHWRCSGQVSGRCWGWGQLYHSQQSSLFWSPNRTFTDRNGAAHRACVSTNCHSCPSHC